VDGNLSSQVVASGLEEVDSSMPTAAGAPYVVRYDCKDTAGNLAVPLYRTVAMVCPGAEFVCSNSDALYCSTGRYCIGRAVPIGEGIVGRVVVEL
jgi:hypothetical protein